MVAPPNGLVFKTVSLCGGLDGPLVTECFSMAGLDPDALKNNIEQQKKEKENESPVPTT